MTKQAFKTKNGIDIFLTEEGKFTATINRREVSRNSLRDIEKLIEQTLVALEVWEISRYTSGPSEPRKQEIIAFERDRPRLKNGSLERSGDRFYIMTEEELGISQLLNERDDKLREEWEAFVDSLQRVDHRNFEEIKKKASGADE